MSLTQRQIDIVKAINDHVNQFPDNDTGTKQLLMSLHEHMDGFKEVMDSTGSDELDDLVQTDPGFGRMAKLLQFMAEQISGGFI